MSNEFDVGIYSQYSAISYSFGSRVTFFRRFRNVAAAAFSSGESPIAESKSSIASPVWWTV